MMDPLNEVPFAQALGCPRCRTTYDVDEGAFRCDQCGVGPLVPLGPKASDPGQDGGSFTRVRNSFVDHAGALGLRPDHMTIIMALARHEWMAGQWVYPSISRICELSLVPRTTAKRRLTELAESGLLLRQGRGRKADGSLMTVAYCLSPLWQRLDSGPGGRSTVDHEVDVVKNYEEKNDLERLTPIKREASLSASGGDLVQFPKAA